MNMLWCSTCKKYLPITEFHKDSGRRSGYSARCKKCVHDRDVSVYGKYKSYKRNANHRNIEFDITFADFKEITSKECSYCGSKEKLNGIDRLDNAKGYTIENCVSCCEWCNIIKIDHSASELKEQIYKMYHYMKLG